MIDRELELARIQAETAEVVEKIKPLLAKYNLLTQELQSLNSQLDRILRESDFLDVYEVCPESREWIDIWLFERKYKIPEGLYCKSCWRALLKREEEYCSECAKQNTERAKAQQAANLLTGVQSLDDFAGE